MSSPDPFVPTRDTVVFVSMSRGIGGPARSLLTVLDNLSDDLDRVLYAPGGDLVRLAQGQALEGKLLMPYRLRLRHLSRLRAAVRLARYVRRHRRHIVAIHANGQTELNLAALAMLLARVPVVMWAHTSKASPTAGALRLLWRRAGHRVRWLAVSETARDTLVATLGIPTDDVALVRNPIDPEQVVTGAVPHEGVRVGYLGLAALHKGFDLLAPIIRELGRDDIGSICTSLPRHHTHPFRSAAHGRSSTSSARTWTSPCPDASSTSVEPSPTATSCCARLVTSPSDGSRRRR